MFDADIFAMRLQWLQLKWAEFCRIGILFSCFGDRKTLPPTQQFTEL